MPPVNDNFVDALIITAPGHLVFSTVGATVELNEPDSRDARTVWFAWVAPADGTFIVDTTSTPLPQWDSTVTIYADSGFFGPPGPGGQQRDVSQVVRIAFGTDALQPGTTGFGTTRCTLTAVGGVRYYIQVAVFNDAAGPDQRPDGVLTYSFTAADTGAVFFGGNYEISYGDPHHVGALAKSKDLETWTPATYTDRRMLILRANDQVWLGVETSNSWWYSVDGYNWDPVTPPFFNVLDIQWSSAQNQWIAVSQGAFNPPIATSPDGRHWTLRSLGAVIDSQIFITGMAHHDQTIVIVGSSNDEAYFFDRFFNYTATSFDAGITWQAGEIAYDYVNYLLPEDSIMNSTTNRWQNNNVSPADYTGVSTSLSGGHNGTGYVQMTGNSPSLVCMTHQTTIVGDDGYRYYVDIGHPIDPGNLLSTADDPYFTTTIEMWFMVNRPMNLDAFAFPVGSSGTNDDTYESDVAPANTWLKLHMEIGGGRASNTAPLLFGLDGFADDGGLDTDWLRVSDVSVRAHIPISQINNVAWANGAWVMGCESWGPVIYRSVDALHWSSVSGTMLDGTPLTGEPPGNREASVAKLQGSPSEFIAIGRPMRGDPHTECFMRSTDGLVWDPVVTPWVVDKSPTQFYNAFVVGESDLVYINNNWVIVAVQNPFISLDTGPWIMRSTDGGRTWIEHGHAFLIGNNPAGPSVQTITYGQTKITAFAINGLVAASGVNFN